MRGRPADLCRLLAITTRAVLVEHHEPLSTLTTFHKPKDIAIMAKQHEQEHRVAGPDDRRQPDGAGENVPAVTTERFPRTVTCAWCGNRYRSACPADIDHGLQGSHCASDVVCRDGEWLVRCGYGSDEHDMHTYRFATNPPNAPADPVCDECISQRLHSGDLVDLGLEVERRPGDFGPRPIGTHILVHSIRALVEDAVAMRKLCEAAVDWRTTSPIDDSGSTASWVGAFNNLERAADAFRVHQRWTGELDDGGEQYTDGAPEVTMQLRESAKALETIANFWERRQADAATTRPTQED